MPSRHSSLDCRLFVRPLPLSAASLFASPTALRSPRCVPDCHFLTHTLFFLSSSLICCFLNTIGAGNTLISLSYFILLILYSLHLPVLRLSVSRLAPARDSDACSSPPLRVGIRRNFLLLCVVTDFLSLDSLSVDLQRCQKAISLSGSIRLPILLRLRI